MRRILIPLVLLASLVAACGGEIASERTSLLGGLPDRAREAGSAKLEMTLDVTAQGQSFTMTGRGAFDFVHDRGRVTLDLGGVPGAPAGLSSFEMILDGRQIYMRLPIPGGAPGGGKTWLRFDPGKFGDLVGSEAFGSADPSQFMEFLRGAGEITWLGKDEVRGAETTHYSVEVDVRRALQLIPAAQRAEAESAIGALGLETFPMDVWLDGNELPRRLEASLEVPEGELHIVTEMFDYGAPVRVDLPDRSDVLEVESPDDLARLFGSAA